MSPASRTAAASLLVGAATAVVLVAVAVVPFLTPAWLGVAQDRAEAAAWTGYSEPDLRAATNALLHDLVIGPPAFDAVVAGEPVLTEPERAHLRDVRTVFGGLAILALAAAVVLVVAARRASPRATWQGVRAGGLALAGVVVLLGIVATVAFEPAFEVFHRLLFTGNYTFDPRTHRLVQLFPDRLWFETSIAVGAVILGLSLAVAGWAGRRAAAPAAPVEDRDAEPGRQGLREAGS
jgi:integral membrane protein (TIGR01906 family)